MNKLFFILKILIVAGMTMNVAAHSHPWQQFELVGEAKLNYLFWQVYKARLYSETGNYVFSETHPFALELEYQRAFSRVQLLDETRKQWQTINVKSNGETTEKWLLNLEGILKDVKKDDVLTLYVDDTQHSQFYLNGSLIGAIEDDSFTENFSAIWLSENTTRQEMRNNLLGND